jgi:alpha-L-rhamnosidase
MLDVRLGEELSGPSSVLYPMRTGNTYQSTWTMAQGLSAFQHHEYMLFRYGEIRSLNTSLTCAVRA